MQAGHGVGLHFVLQRDGNIVRQRTIEKVVTDDTPDYSGSQFSTKKGAMTQLMADSLRLVLADLPPQLQSAAGQVR